MPSKNRKNGVVFRRIRGRIVPIKVSREQKIGTVSVFSGGALALAGGRASGKLSRVANRERNVSRSMRRFLADSIKQGRNISSRSLAMAADKKALRAFRLKGLSRAGLLGTTVAASSIIHLGIKAVRSKDKKDSFTDVPVAFAVATALTTAAFLRGSNLSRPVMKVVKKGVQRAIRKVRRGK